MDFFLFHGKFWLGGGRFAPALLIRGGRIAAIGDRRELALRAEGCSFIDCGGRTAIPGFYDPCLCLAAAGSPLPEGMEGLSPAVQTCMTAHPRAVKKGSLLFWQSAEADPDGAALDAMWPHSPLVLQDVARQRSWANGAALALLEGRGLPQKLACHVEFTDDGRPTGRFSGPACRYLAELLPKPGPQQVQARLLAGLERCARAGITSVRSLDREVWLQRRDLPVIRQLFSQQPALPQVDFFDGTVTPPERLSLAQWQPGQQLLSCPDGPALDAVLSQLERHPLPAENFRRMTLLGACCTEPRQLQAMGKQALGVIGFPQRLERQLVACMGQPGCRMDTCCAYRTLRGLGAHVAFAGLDSARPWRGIQKAVCREGKEALMPEEALDCVAAGAAWTAFADDFTGRLAPGFRADVQVLDSDPFSLPVSHLGSLCPVLVLAEGQVIHREI